jgi:BirA family biotin operon repressor/biotin-[acetyl-CoA-carboxylase] ligase
MAVTLAVRDTISEACLQPGISLKWPNDIYVDDRKIAGILIQNTIQGNNITSCIAGIGINVNNREFPDDLPNPASMLLASPSVRTYDMAEVRIRLQQHLSDRLSSAESRNKVLSDDYLNYLYRRNQLSQFKRASDGTGFVGMVSHPDASGRLVIRHEDGSQEAFQFREIEFLL